MDQIQISLDDGRQEHRAPPEGAECKVTWDDIDETNYCEYQTAPSMLWFPAQACETAVEHMRTIQFHDYLKKVEKADCAAEMRRLLDAGPPIYIEEREALPLPNEETHILQLWYMSNNRTISARLEGALDGEERQKLWDSLTALNKFALDKNEDDDKTSTGKNGQDDNNAAALSSTR